MATFLARVGRSAFRRRRLVLLLWVVLLGLAGAGAAGAGTGSSTITIPGTEAQKAFDLLDERVPTMHADGATARVVLRAPDGEKVTGAAQKAEVERVVGDLKASSDEVAAVTDPYESGAVSKDGSTAFTQVSYKVKSFELEHADRDGLQQAAEDGREAGLTVEIGGDALQEAPETGATEIIGVGIAAVVLLMTFGSLVAAGLPLLTALIGVGISVAAITALSVPLDLNSTTPTLAMMLGLAVGIDYALFIVSRYRAERAEGRAPLEAVGRANGTAGSAVIFAGLTVLIALAGLSVVNIPILTKMGLAAAGAVAIAVLIATTLIPALLGFAGDRALSRKERARVRNASGADPGAAGGGGKPALGTRWARFVLRRPVAVLLTAVVGLGAVALPASSMELGLPDDGSQPTDTTQRKAYDMLAESFGKGANGPLTLAVDARGSDSPEAAARQVADEVKGLKDAATVNPPAFNEAGDTAVLAVIPKSGPSDTATEDLVHDIRDRADGIKADTGATVLVTGTTALNIDVSQRLSDAMLPYLVLVVGLAFLLLIVVFRSLLVPLKAALGFLLSVVAALGAVVAVFQWGWLGGLFGVEETGPVMSMMPIFLIGVVFGLAMDYEVFLVTRMREAYVHGESPDEAVVTGFAHGARVVTAAAVIMISVFAGFIGSSEAMVKMIGFGLAVAVLFDAFVVRMTIVPAVLKLLGRSAWWLPRRLDRILPDVDVEGAKLAAEPSNSRAATAEDGGGEEPEGERELVGDRG
ncbi:MMPL family transporter [Streptomyces boncukensis]|uniref:MMPL family transporter n=1 Tax=Streptomyces boncukensis TaxID=2711219 RepID=A0A6G4WXW0_9ACTN|nr:MMPL family transporter [Streptomyces boncukensis]NGO69470.1 MMPL family transporter [Streptomyces boncukensis]